MTAEKLPENLRSLFPRGQKACDIGIREACLKTGYRTPNGSTESSNICQQVSLGLILDPRISAPVKYIVCCSLVVFFLADSQCVCSSDF